MVAPSKCASLGPGEGNWELAAQVITLTPLPKVLALQEQAGIRLSNRRSEGRPFAMDHREIDFKNAQEMHLTNQISRLPQPDGVHSCWQRCPAQVGRTVPGAPARLSNLRRPDGRRRPRYIDVQVSLDEIASFNVVYSVRFRTGFGICELCSSSLKRDWSAFSRCLSHSCQQPHLS